MPKTIKGIAGRKPPEPGASRDDVTDWIGRQMPNIQPVVERLDKAIQAAIPNAQLAVHRNRTLYGLPDLGWVVELAPYHVSANVLFYGGADFASPPPLGNTDRTRYVKVTTIDDSLLSALSGWLDQAVRIPGWR